MSTLNHLATKIIKEQEQIIGPIAWDEARKVKGLRVIDSAKGEVAFENGETETLNLLVAQYERLFGRASVEVCKEAVRTLKGEIPQGQLPELLR